MKEQKQSELLSSDEKVHVIDDKSWKTLSDEEDGAGLSSADEGPDKDSKKSLDAQKEEHKTLKKMKSQTSFYPSPALKWKFSDKLDQQDHVEDESHENDEENWVSATSSSGPSCGQEPKLLMKMK